MVPPGGSSAPQRSWRGRSAKTQATPSARWMPRVLLSALCLGLLSLFVWLIVQWIFLPTVHFAYLPIVDYDVLAAPPVRFVQEDVQAFAGVAPHRAAVELRDLQTSDAMPTLTRRLEGCQTAGKDTLVLYVAGHGIAEDGTAYLLCSDFLRRDAPGRYPLGDLLTELEAFPADLKLLILDAGRLPYDARLGVLVNEFPRLLEEALKQHQDPRLWVLSANRVFETSHVSSPAQQSPFGYYLAEAIRGEADRDGNAQVDLAELADYVRAGVSQWVQRDSGGRDGQTPQLLQAGAGSTSTPPPLTLTPVPRQLSESEKALARDTEGQPEAPPTAESKPVGGDAESGTVAAKAVAKPEAAASKQGAEPPMPAVAPELQEARRLLAQAWAARDAFQARPDSGAWLPADYAPHLWREYQETLLGYEQRLWAGQAFQAKEMVASLQKEVLPLTAVLRDAAVPAGVDRGTVLGRLAEARQQFVASEARVSYEQPLPGIQILREAIQLGNELTLDAAYLVRWHAAASASSPQSLTVYQPLRQLLDQGLPALRKLLDEFLTADSIAAPGRGDRQAKLDDLRRLLDQLRQLRDQIERDGIQREAQQLASEVSAGGQAKGVAGRIDGFLATPLLPAPLRQALLEARGRLDSSFGPPDLGSVASPPPAVPGWRRERLREQGQLEIRLVAWADPEAAAGLEARVAAVKQADEQLAKGGDDGPWWQAWRQLGADLSAVYRDLPVRIRQLGPSPDPAAGRQAARLLRLVDARDAHRVELAAAALAVPRLPRPVETPPTLAVAGPDFVDLDSGVWQPLEFTVGPASLAIDQAVVSVEYDAGAIEIEAKHEATTEVADEWQAVSSGQPQRVQWRRNDPRVLAYRVRPRSPGPKAVDVAVSLTARGQTASHHLGLRVRAPEIVELAVSGPPLASDRPPGSEDRIRLLPFPNRVTPYRFQLVNRSGKARRVRVELWSRPPSGSITPATSGPAHELPLDATGMLRPGFERLHGPLDVDLPADPTPVGIPFPPPPPAGGAESSKPAADAASGPPADKRPVVSAGLVCLVADTAQPDLQWNTGVDFALRPPRDYLETQVVYDPAGQRIAIRVRPRDADGDGQPNVELLPPSAVEEPIAVVWDTAGVLAAGTEMKDQAELAAPGYAATLFARVEPQAEKRIPVRLAIDGYPRAFLYQVRCDRTGRPAEPERSPCRIRITSPTAGDAFLAPAEAIPVEFQVDAPEDAFQKPGDVVELGLDEDGDRTLRQERKLQWHSDRQVTVRLHKVDPDGQVQFHAEVADFRVPVPAGGLRNKAVDVLARLIVNLPVTGQGQLTDQSEVSVVLDGAPPILRVEVPVRPIMAGEEIPVTIVTEDLSGVAKGRVG
nr:caspase family protein [Pirellulaceae bacterium]